MSLSHTEIVAVAPTVYGSSAMGRGIGGQTMTTGIGFTPINVGFYPAGEPYVKDLPKDITHLIVRPLSMDTLMAALFVLDVSADLGYEPIELVLPYFPGGRQDRINRQGDQLFTARSIARIINEIDNISKVKILDPHSDVTPALLDNCKVYGADFALGHEATFFSTLPHYDGVIAPDAGSEKRAQSVARLMEIPVHQGNKFRDVRTGELQGFVGLEDIKDGHYLVVDDICDGGGTFLGLAEEFRPNVTADLYVTHGIFSSPGNLYMLKKNYGKLYCTDSLIVHEDVLLDGGVTIIPVVERML